METSMAAIEVTGTVDQDHKLLLDAPLPIQGPRQVRVIVLYSPADDQFVDDEQEELEWLKAMSRNPVFADLADPAEDIYTLSDGRPFHVES